MNMTMHDLTLYLHNYDFQSLLHQGSSRCVLHAMKIMLAQQQSKLLVLVESLFQASLVLDLIDDEGFSDEDDIMDVLKLTAFKWMKIAIMMSDGWHGPYNVFPKSQDLILISLQAPDCYFCKMFWSIQFQSVYAVCPASHDEYQDWKGNI